MGHQHSKVDFNDITARLEKKAGRIALSGRYHQAPAKVEDDYKLCNKVLGSGCNGVVQLAFSRHYKAGTQRFAVKMLHLANVVGNKRQQMQAEIEVYLCTDHPHIARLYDIYDAGDYLYLVMECMEGGELFDRVQEFRRFSECDAADAVWQMLLAISYLHNHGIVHRDLKMENFLYDTRSRATCCCPMPAGKRSIDPLRQQRNHHLKLIDFGFSHMFDPNIQMAVSCGTLAYVAPEVLKRSYTSKCDLWSLGVITFVLLSGQMPFSGSQKKQVKKISDGAYVMRPERWKHISVAAKNFTTSLLEVDPDKRLSTAQALEHDFIRQLFNSSDSPLKEVDHDVVDALRQFGQASKFRRCCLGMMAWSLTSEERSQVYQYFLAMDTNKHGTITLAELKHCLEEKFNVSDRETRAIFAALDTNSDEEIHYSDFLAAMVSTRITLHDDLLRVTFKKFDTDNSGYITVDNLREVLGDSYDGEEVEELLAEVDLTGAHRISYPEFVTFLRGDPLRKEPVGRRWSERRASAGADIIEATMKEINACAERRNSSKEAAFTSVMPSLTLSEHISEERPTRLTDMLRVGSSSAIDLLANADCCVSGVSASSRKLSSKTPGTCFSGICCGLL